MSTLAQGRERGNSDPGGWGPPHSPPSPPSHDWPSFWKTKLPAGATPRRVTGVLRGDRGTFVFLVADGPGVDASLPAVKVHAPSPPHMYWWPAHVFKRLGEGGCGCCCWGMYIFFISADNWEKAEWERNVHPIPLTASLLSSFPQILETSTPAIFSPLPFFKKTLLWLLLFGHQVVSDSLPPHGLQHSRLPCLSLSHGICSDSCPLSQWCHPTSSSSAAFFSYCLQSFSTSESFPVSGLLVSSGQSIGASASVLPMNSQAWFPLGLTKSIWSPCSPRDSQESSLY